MSGEELPSDDPPPDQERPPRGAIFRKEALDKLAAPEQLDELIKVTTVEGWIGLAGFGVLIATAIAWALLGRVPTKVGGQGILIRSGGVFNVVALGSGQIMQVLVAVGDKVEKDQVVARLAQPALVDEIDKARSRLDELRAQELQRSQLGKEGSAVQGQSIEQEREAAFATINASQQRLGWLKDKLASEEKLVKDGLITKEALLQTRREYQQAREEIDRARTLLKQVAVKALEFKSSKSKESLSGQLAISEQERALALLEQRLDLSSKVTSPHAGRVLEVRSAEGSLVQPGTPILNLEHVATSSAAGRLEGILYLPPADGKKLRAGLDVQLSPATVRREEHGFVLGRVRAVAEFPSTRQGMMRLLENEALVQKFMDGAGGAPIAVEVELLRDPAAPSGFSWSSGRGPPVGIDSGTPATGQITVKSQRPIQLVLPALRRLVEG
jgi:HlyD family secretion protein